MNCRPYPAEPERYLVDSDTRPEVTHIVDVAYVECPGDQPRVQCSCERGLANGEACRHILEVAEYLKGQR